MAIHELTATDMLRHLETGELTSVQIVEALNARRRDVDPKVNAIIMTREQAFAEAESADQARAKGESLGPLHGLPITIKDNIQVTGTDATLGMQCRRGKAADADAVLVAELRKKGAIVLGKTNVPQLLLAQETENSLFGVTNNPWNLERVPGGSSGGEGAAVAAGMSPLGIGTDIGGSIRVPSLCAVRAYRRHRTFEGIPPSFRSCSKMAVGRSPWGGGGAQFVLVLPLMPLLLRFLRVLLRL